MAREKTRDGLVAEGDEIMAEFAGMAAVDAGLIAAAQAAEHHEMARYGTLKRRAEERGMKDAARLLGETLQEEMKTDSDLTKLALAGANGRAKLRAAA